MLLKPILICCRSSKLQDTTGQTIRNFLTLTHSSHCSQSHQHLRHKLFVINYLNSDTRSFTYLSKTLAFPANPKSKSKSSLPPGGPSTLANAEPPVVPKKDDGSESKPEAKARSQLSKFLELPEDGKRRNSLQGLADAEWRTIYMFTHIKSAHIVQRFKLYQTAFTCLFIAPTSLGCYLAGVVDSSIITLTLSASLFATGMLYVMGNFFAKLVGRMYVTDADPDIVRVAHMTFWGTRQDEIFLKKDLVPLSELPDNLTDAYIHMKIYSDPDYALYLTLKYGEVHDHEEFENIFGRISAIPIATPNKSSKM